MLGNADGSDPVGIFLWGELYKKAENPASLQRIYPFSPATKSKT